LQRGVEIFNRSKNLRGDKKRAAALSGAALSSQRMRKNYRPGRDNGFTVPSFLPFFTAFAFAILLFLLFILQDLGVALHVNDCNPEAKKTESQVFLLRYQNKELVSTSNVDSRMFHR
jgi:hypothetical protein